MKNEINIFFNSENFNLLGWKIKDMYQNHSIIYISYTKINEEINDNIFSLPIQN